MLEFVRGNSLSFRVSLRPSLRRAVCRQQKKKTNKKQKKQSHACPCVSFFFSRTSYNAIYTQLVTTYIYTISHIHTALAGYRVVMTLALRHQLSSGFSPLIVSVSSA